MIYPVIVMGLWGLYGLFGLFGALRPWSCADFRYALVGKMVTDRVDEAS